MAKHRYTGKRKPRSKHGRTAADRVRYAKYRAAKRQLIREYFGR